MTLTDFAAIAEIVGAVAIVVTIIYLAVQVKHSRESLDANTRAIRGQAISDVTSNIADHMAMITQGHDVANVIKRMGADEILESEDALLLDMTMTAVFVARQNEYFQWKSGLLEDAVFRSLHHITLTVLKTKTAAAPSAVKNQVKQVANRACSMGLRSTNHSNTGTLPCYRDVVRYVVGERS